MQQENNVHLLYKLYPSTHSITASYVTTKEFTPMFPKQEKKKFVPDTIISAKKEFIKNKL